MLESDKVDDDYQRGVKITYGKDGSEKRTPQVIICSRLIQKWL